MIKKYPHKHSSQKGFTLIEIMVATAISLILLTGVIQLFVSNQKTYKVQEAVSRLQENVRFASHLLTTDIRNADMWGCHGDISNISDSHNIATTGIEGTDGDNDELTVRGAYQSGMPLTATATLPNNINLSTSSFEKDDIILISDCEKGDITSVSSITKNGGLTTTGGSNTYNTDASVWQPREITYYIGDGAGGLPGLFRKEKNFNLKNINDEPSTQGVSKNEVVEGVEDFQVLYGIDTDGTPDGSANQYVTAGIAKNNWQRVVSARINMTLISLNDNLTTTTKNGDKRIRHKLSTTIVLRNRST